MNRVRKQIGYDAAVRQQLSGNGIGIGVLDSGIFLHVDLNARCIQFVDFVNGSSRPYDDLGHGTHICGIIAGNGTASRGYYQGMAPACSLYVGKILNEKGEGDIGAMIRGMEWLLDIAAEENIKLINISVSSFSFRDKFSERRLFELFREAYENNILVIVAAGNHGPEGSSISKLGDTVHTVCVGCHDGAYYINDPFSCEKYSGQGPGHSVYLKPDIVAPGTRILSCKNVNRQYSCKSGTSMAAPIVTGALALAWEKYNHFTAFEMKRRLLQTADDLGEKYLKQGFGMISLHGLLEG